jgi:hypothetical protein
MQNAEIIFSIGFFQDRVVDTADLVRGASAVTSLATQLPKLVKLSIYLVVDVSSMREDQAKSGEWVNVASHDGSGSLINEDHASLPRVQEIINALLQVAKFHGPGQTKIFKLFVKRPHFYYGPRPKEWMPWIRRCDGVEFHSLDDVSGVLQKAIDSSAERPWT